MVRKRQGLERPVHGDARRGDEKAGGSPPFQFHGLFVHGLAPDPRKTVPRETLMAARPGLFTIALNQRVA